MALCTGSTGVINTTGATLAVGLTYQWQESPDGSTSWVNASGTSTNASYTTAPYSANIYYRRIITCTSSSSSDTTNVCAVTGMPAPPYATFDGVSYNQGFESWSNRCNTTDVPSVNWLNTPGTGLNSWRRNDQGASAGWLSSSGGYSPASQAGTYSARFHTVEAPNLSQGTLDLYIDMSAGDGTTKMKFGYINTNGADVLGVSMSTDGGSTFTSLGTDLGQSAAWADQLYSITSTSATTIIRFKATSDLGTSDIGLDNVRIFTPCVGTPAAAVASANPASVCSGNTTVITATGTGNPASGITFQWEQSADGLTGWVPVTGGSGATTTTYTTPALSVATYYRLNQGCSYSGQLSYSNVVPVTINTPTYATYNNTSFTEDFENWSNACNTTDAPSVSWRVSPYTGNNSWRRDDQAASAAWTSATSGGYTPVFTTGAHSARFHSYATTASGSLDLFIDMTAATGPTRLTFDYINTSVSGSEGLKVMLSTDGGANFTQVGNTLAVGATWANKFFDFNSNVATTVVRLQATGGGTTDIGVDNLMLAPSPSCVAPLNVTAAIASLNSVNLNWVASVSNPANGYQWEARTSGAGGSGATGLQASGTVGAGITTAVATPLLQDSTYTFYVRADCGSGDFSTWNASSSTFFGYCKPAPTSVSGTGITNVAFGTLNNPSGAETGNYGNYTAILGGDVQQTLNANVAITYATGTTYGTKIWVDWNNDLDFNDAGELVYTGLSAAANPTTLNASFNVGTHALGAYRMRIGGTDTDAGPSTPCYTGTLGAFEDYTLNITAPPSCVAPTGLTVAAGAPVSTLSWVASTSNPSIGYQWEVRTSGAPGSGATGLTASGIANVPDTSAAASGLAGTTAYSAYVRAICAVGDTSVWIGLVNFTTPCITANIPYSENFDAVTTPAIPTCMSIQTVSGNPWATVTAPTGYTGKVARVSYTGFGSPDMDSWIYTQGLNLTGGTSYRLSYKYGNNSTSYVERMSVSYGAGVAEAQMTTLLADHATINDNTPHTNTVDFTPATTGVYNIGFKCYSIADQYYLYLDEISVIVTPSCEAPTALGLDSVFATSGYFHWTQSTSAPANGYQWEVRTSGVGGSGATGLVDSGNNAAGDTTASTALLAASTTYQLYVRSDCGGLFSTWAGPLSFTTPCLPVSSFPYVESFSATMPNCWSASEGAAGASQHWAPTTADGTHGAAAPAAGSNFMYLYVYLASTTYNPYYLTTGQFDLGATPKMLQYNYYLGSSGYTTTPVPLTVQISTDDGTTWTDLYAHTPGNSTFATDGSGWQLNTIDLSAYVNTTATFRFESQSNYGYGFCDQGIDEFQIYDLPSCIAPTGLAVSSISSNGADLAWQQSSSLPANGYQWDVRDGADAVVASGSTAAGDTTDVASGLTAITGYNLYVRAICGAGDTSMWAGPVNFTTLCDPTNIPYLEDFSTVTVPALPACMTQQVPSGPNWVSYATPPTGMTGPSARNYGDMETGADSSAWLYTAPLNLTAGTTYRLMYKYSNAYSYYTNALAVAYGNNPTEAAMTTTLVDHPSITDGLVHQDTAVFTPATTGVYYIGFHRYAPASSYGYYMYVDDISVDLNPVCYPPEASAYAIPDCSNNQFYVGVNLTSLGSATSVGISSDYSGNPGGVATATVVDSTYIIGPFADLSVVNVTVLHNDNSLCNDTLDPVTFNCADNGKNALSFDGVNDQVVLGNTPSLNIAGNQITLEAWIYPTAWRTTSWQGNIINNEGGNIGYMIRCGANGTFSFNLGDGSGWHEVLSQDSALTLNTWQHVAGTYDGSTMRIYVNGVELANSAATFNIVSSANGTEIGDWSNGTGRNFPGKIDEVRIWNKALIVDSIQAHMNTAYCGYESGLVGYYRFDQAVAFGSNPNDTTLYDLTAYANNGDLQNFALNGPVSNWVVGVTNMGDCVPVSCSGVPNPGNTLSTVAQACPSGNNFTLSFENSTAGAGVVRQWQSADDAAFTTNVGLLGTGLSQVVTNQTSDTWYRCMVICTSGPDTAYSAPVLVPMGSVCTACGYPVSAAMYTADEDISNVTVGTMSNSSDCSTLAPGSGSVLNLYSNFTGSVSGPSAAPGDSVPYSLTMTTCGTYPYTNGFAIYIDLNQDGDFLDAGERVYSQPANVAGNQTVSGNFFMPYGALAGSTRMRVVNVEGYSSSTNYAQTTYGYGETEDYCFTILPPPPCAPPIPVVSNITATGADLGWTYNGANSYNYLVITGVDTVINANVASGSPAFAISPLTPNTPYTVFVQSVCDGGATLSAWSSGVAFTTPCVAVNIPYAEDFSSVSSPAIPSCMSIQAVNGAPWVTYDFPPTGFTAPTARSYGNMTSTGNNSSWLYTAGLNLTGGSTYRLSYKYSNAYNFYTNALKVAYGTGANDAAMTNVLVDHTTINDGLVHTDVLDFTPSATGVYYIGFDKHSPSTANGYYMYVDDISVVELTPCAGMPNPGATSGPAAACTSSNFTLGLGNNPGNVTGFAYQWQSSADGTTWANAAGTSTNLTYTTTQTDTTWYRCRVVCTATSDTAFTTPLQVNMGDGCQCGTYPAVFASNTADEDISNVTVGAMSNSSTCASVALGTGSIQNRYSNYTGVVAGPSEAQGNPVSFSLTQTTCGTYPYTNGFGIYIDWNHDGDFLDAGEIAYSQAANAAGDQTVTGSFTVPLTATVGTTRMRVVNVEGFNPATNYGQTGYGYGETEDYCFTVTPAQLCTGTPAPGNTISSVATACSGSNFNLSVQNATLGLGVTYQWQSADDAAFTTNLALLGTATTQVASQTAAKYYRCMVICASGPDTAYSTPVQVTMGDGCVCGVYPAVYANYTGDEDITNVTVGTMNNSSTCGTTAPGPGSINQRYSNYTGSVAGPSVMQTQPVPFSLTMTTCGGTYGNGFGIYIDWNQDGDFADAGEVAYAQTANGNGNQTVTGSFTVPATALLGNTRMRVVNVEGFSSATNYGQSSYGWGETEDYCITVLPAPSCTAPTALAIGTTGITTASFSWTASTSNPSGGYEWEVRTSGAPGSGATGLAASGNATGTTASVSGLTGNTSYAVYVRSNCGGGNFSFWAGPLNFGTGAACGDAFVDDGGIAGPYSNGQDMVKTYCRTTPGDQVRVLFSSFNTEASWDKLFVFNGPTTASPKFASANDAGYGPTQYGTGGWWGDLTNNLPGPFTSNNASGCLTFAFVSDASFNYAGWEAITQCVTPNNTCATATPVLCGNSYLGSTTGVPHNMPANACPYNGAASTGGQNWWLYTATADEAVTFSTCGASDFDTRISVFSGTDCNNLACVSMNDDGVGCAGG
ncbi:MAG: hypothetical protein JST45_09425, partial [Bacteroidetes bacterium]|nr:hypothetical protein [Bacteroidota bacterium]